ncbi:MAG: hypothetical protein OHK0017_06010 [Patescibacteria group bacterium]
MILPSSAFTVLYCLDVEQTKSFYELIGANIKEFSTDKVVVDVAGHDLHFILNTAEPFEEYRYVAETGNFGQGVLFYFEVEDLEKFYQLVNSAGGSIKTKIKANHWDCSEFLFEDPNGFKLVAYK